MFIYIYSCLNSLSLYLTIFLKVLHILLINKLTCDNRKYEIKFAHITFSKVLDLFEKYPESELKFAVGDGMENVCTYPFKSLMKIVK